ncbi:protein Mis18-alpha-like isoform X2 [Hyla sarda]|uniref:protein Mis18-alpha-like isoform X2 n=1 Tax=Hyla sarda TaxID=327740 RepID=UPI0024C26118|nr:protein Mis18-alpha-like isoform X2 [Hyla sarda]XP_056423147.1 protein Mis18-alpha-like isoform X2 [Hyla sarda]
MSVSIDVTVQEGEGSSDPAVDLAVFLCRKCKLPLGDTGDWVEKAENGDILLSAVTENVKIDVNKAVSSFIHDAYSTVQTLQCKGCKSIVGALYIATPEHLDYKRDLFILNTSVLNCYFFANAHKQRAKINQTSVNLPTIRYMDEKLKKCKQLFGACEREVTEMEKKLFQSSENP